jgi:hypothetical protein
MGFNTIAFLLNDHMHQLARSPNTVTWALTHPPHSKDELEQKSWRAQVQSVAREHNEPMLDRRALELLPTFHADCHKFFFAGGNNIVELETMKFGWADGQTRKTVTLELPEWWTFGLKRKPSRDRR